MRTAWTALSLVLAGVAALAAALVVAPAPNRTLAFLAVVIGEKTFLAVAAAVAGGVLAWRSLGPGHRVVPGLALALATFAVAVGLLPPIQGRLLARRRRVDFRLGCYLVSPVDIGQPRPSRTVVFASVDGQALSADVYDPSPSNGRGPAVIVVHGGGWSSGDKGETPRWSERLAAAGYTVFDIQYRLEPAPTWRIATGDVKCAIAWVKQQPSVDPARVALLGRSAGGHLALLAAYTAGDDDLPSSCRGGDTAVEAVVAFYAPTDLAWGHDHPANQKVYDSTFRLERFLGGSPATVPDAYHQASVTNRVTARAPRTLLVHGGRDQFVSVENLRRLAARLSAAGVEHDALALPYGQHGFDYVVDGLGGQIAQAVVLRFLGGHP